MKISVGMCILEQEKKKKHAFVMFKGRIVSKEVALRKRWETSLNVEKKLGNAGKGG